MLAIQGAKIFRLVRMKQLFFRDPHASRGPHIADVHVLIAIIVEIEPACAHSGADVFDVALAGDGHECPIAIVEVKVAASKIVGDV